MPNAAYITVMTNDKEGSTVTCDTVISHIEEEVIINDELPKELGIVILAAGSGRWRFVDDDITRVRPSEAPQYW